jgi:hypothetical protein
MPVLGICPTDDFEPNSGEVLRVDIVVNDLKDLAPPRAAREQQLAGV